MKLAVVFAVLASLAIVASGCGKGDDAPATPPDPSKVGSVGFGKAGGAGVGQAQKPTGAGAASSQ